jgi:hypothetical protein
MQQKNTEKPLLVVDLSDARELIHDALEYLHSYDQHRPINLDFKKAFGATDTLLDMSEVLHAFEKSGWPDDLGMSYLLTLGTLQALVIQQDATKHLCEVFGIKFLPQQHPELLSIRDIRARAAGHPSRHGRDGRSPRKGEEGSTFLVRRRFTKENAPIVTNFDAPALREASDINLLKLYLVQQHSLCKILRLVWTKILVDYPDAALFRWNPWLFRETYRGSKIIIKLD